jgi:hypothetical protein
MELPPMSVKRFQATPFVISQAQFDAFYSEPVTVSRQTKPGSTGAKGLILVDYISIGTMPRSTFMRNSIVWYADKVVGAKFGVDPSFVAGPSDATIMAAMDAIAASEGDQGSPSDPSFVAGPSDVITMAAMDAIAAAGITNVDQYQSKLLDYMFSPKNKDMGLYAKDNGVPDDSFIQVSPRFPKAAYSCLPTVSAVITHPQFYHHLCYHLLTVPHRSLSRSPCSSETWWTTW